MHKVQGIKREHGEEEPRGTKSVTAPATVSEEQTVNPLGEFSREGTASEDPRSQETCHHDLIAVSGGGPVMDGFDALPYTLATERTLLSLPACS